MAVKPKKSTAVKATNSEANVTRIKATDADSNAKVVSSAIKAIKPTKSKLKTPSRGLLRPLVATGEYFKGAWYELLQVRWPDRRATWSLTAAVLIFSAFFTVLIVLLDALFKYLFELILK